MSYDKRPDGVLNLPANFLSIDPGLLSVAAGRIVSLEDLEAGRQLFDQAGYESAADCLELELTAASDSIVANDIERGAHLALTLAVQGSTMSGEASQPIHASERLRYVLSRNALIQNRREATRDRVLFSHTQLHRVTLTSNLGRVIAASGLKPGIDDVLGRLTDPSVTNDPNQLQNARYGAAIMALSFVLR